MHDPADLTEPILLPSLEAVLAGTLALMTGYSQALQADQSPAQRLLMGTKIGSNLELLVDHPCLTEAFRRVMEGLRKRWYQMGVCTELAAPASPCCPADSDRNAPAEVHFRVPSPARIQ